MRFSDPRYVPARQEDRVRGLLGWIGITLPGDIRVESIAVRRTREGRHALSFPSRRDASGAEHSIVRPLTHAARNEIEDQVLGYLRERGYVS